MSKLRFVILSDSRSGTSLLSETLNSHPDIVCHGEVFHPTPASHIRGGLSSTNIEELLALRERDAGAFVERVFQQPDVSAVGFKMWRSQNEQICDALMADPSVLKIIYERTNVLARFSSSRLVQATGIYNLPAGRARPQKLDARIGFNRKAFTGYLQKHVELFACYRNGSVGPTLELTYEQVKNAGFDSALAFLGVSERPLKPQKEKLHGASIIDRCEPQCRDLIREMLDMTGHPEWVSE